MAKRLDECAGHRRVRRRPGEISRFAGESRIYLEPVGQNVFGTLGRVDLLVWPALYQAPLLFVAKRNPTQDWTLQLDSGIDYPDGWSKNSFYKLEGLSETGTFHIRHLRLNRVHLVAHRRRRAEQQAVLREQQTLSRVLEDRESELAELQKQLGG